MRDNFVKLMDFIFGKYMYTVMKNNDKVLYFEVVNNKYVQPISSFNLYDNEGKSLTSVNEHFFMNQLVSRINVACKKGIFISDQEIVDFLNKIKASCGDSELMKLFKGSYMNEINEFNFEDNKRNIVRYLDKFKFDTFVDYNNVSVFNGSLEKNPSASSIQPVTGITQDENKNIGNSVMSSESVNFDNSNNMEVVDIVDEPTIDFSNESDNQQSEVVNPTGFDFMNIPVDDSLGDVVSSSDYFSNSQVVQNNDDQVNNQSIQPVVQENVSSSKLTSPLDYNPLYSNNESVQGPIQPEVQEVQQAVQPQEFIQPQIQDVVQPVQEQSGEQIEENPALKPATTSVDLTAPLDFNSLYSNNENTPVQDVVQESNDQSNIQMIPNSDFASPDFNGINNQNEFVNSVDASNQNQTVNNEQNVEYDSFHNDGFSLAEPLVENAIDSNLSNNNVMYSEQVAAPSYINEVKSRFEDNAFNTELGIMDSNVTESDLEKTVVVDKVNMPPLESVFDEKPKKAKEKKTFGVIIFIIVLLLALAGFAYFLYNYIF